MGIDKQTYAASKKFTKDSLIGVGALMGAPCKIDSIVQLKNDTIYPDRVTSNRITFSWEDDNGVSHTNTMDVDNGESFSIADVEQLHDNPVYPAIVTGYKITVDNYTKAGGATQEEMYLNCGDQVRISNIEPKIIGGKVVGNIITFQSWSAELGSQATQLEILNGADGSVVTSVDQLYVRDNVATYRFNLADGTFYTIDIPIANAIPTGGLKNQILAKNTDRDGDYSWTKAPVSLPDGGNAGQVLVKRSATNGDAQWKDAPKSIPAGGGQGDLLVKRTGSDYDAEWLDDNAVMFKATYDTDRDGKVDKAEDADALINSNKRAFLKAIATDTYVLTELNLGQTVVPIDTETGLMDVRYLPDSIIAGLSFGGTFNATTKVATLTNVAKIKNGATTATITLTNNSTPVTGYVANYPLFYITEVEGSFAGFNFEKGDWLLALQNQWYKIEQSGRVTTVNGRTGAVVLTTDEINEGNTNKYMTAAERAKLQGIENEAQKNPLNYIKTAALNADETELTLTDQSNNQIKFKGGDPDTFVEKLGGDASKTKVTYRTSGQREAFSQRVSKSEDLDYLLSNIIQWLVSLHNVAFTGSYNDLLNKKEYLSQFNNDGNGTGATNDYFITMLDLLATCYKKTETYTKAEVDELFTDIAGLNAEVVSSLPVGPAIDRNTLYYLELTDPTTGQVTGYNMYRYISNAWADLGTLDIDLSNYVRTDGDISTTVIQTIAAVTGHSLLQPNVTASQLAGAFNALITDLKNIAYTGEALDVKYDNRTSGLLHNNAQQAIDELKELADEKLDLNQGSDNSGKVMMVNDDGDLEPASISAGVVRRGRGGFSVVGGDNEANEINDATGLRSSAFGDHVTNTSRGGMSIGRYNEEDTSEVELFAVGNGTAENPSTSFKVTSDGVAYNKFGFRVGTVTNPATMIQTVANELTTKYYVDKTVAEATADKAEYMVVAEVPEPEDADANIIYLVREAGTTNVYAMWKKVVQSIDPVTEEKTYTMAALGTSEMNLNDYQKINDNTLATTTKTVPGAINELLNTIGNLDDLETVVKDDIVSAINSVLEAGDVLFKVMTAGETLRSYADGVRGAYVLSTLSNTAGNPVNTQSTVISIPIADKSYYYQFCMAGNVSLYLRRIVGGASTESEWQQVSAEALQYDPLPQAKADYVGKTWQYVGTSYQFVNGTAQYPGMWYQCINQQYYCWLNNSSALKYYTKSATPSKYDIIYTASFQAWNYKVSSVSGSTMTDMNGVTYTRLSFADTTHYEWNIINKKTSDLNNNGRGTGDPLDFFITKKDLLDYVFPVGTIYTTTGTQSPADFLGGTWSLVGKNRVLWGVAADTAAGSTLAEQLPNIYGNVDFTGGSQGHPEVTYESGALRKSDYGNLTYPQPSGKSSAYHGIVLDASKYNSVYTANGIVRPNAYTVHFWQRTA